MSLTAVSNTFSNTSAQIESSSSHLPRFVLVVANYVRSQFLLLFFKPSYERNYYNLTSHLFVKECSCQEEKTIYNLFKAISEARTPVNLKTVQKMVIDLGGKNARCILTQALYIANSGAHSSIQNFIINELKKLENDKTQNSRFIPTPDRSLSSTLIRLGIIGGAALLVGALVYYGYSTGILGKIFSFGSSNTVQASIPSPTIETVQTLIPPATPDETQTLIPPFSEQFQQLFCPAENQRTTYPVTDFFHGTMQFCNTPQPKNVSSSADTATSLMEQAEDV